VTLIIVGRIFARAKPTLGFKLALAMNLIALILAGSELRRNTYDKPLWVQSVWAQRIAERLDLRQ
jgi:hypothetical protein